LGAGSPAGVQPPDPLDGGADHDGKAEGGQQPGRGALHELLSPDRCGRAAALPPAGAGRDPARRRRQDAAGRRLDHPGLGIARLHGHRPGRRGGRVPA